MPSTGTRQRDVRRSRSTARPRCSRAASTKAHGCLSRCTSKREKNSRSPSTGRPAPTPCSQASSWVKAGLLRARRWKPRLRASWAGVVGHEGYDLAGWGNSAEDVSDLPASVSLVKGARYQWTAGTTETRALTDPTGSLRNAGAYYDPNEIQLQLTFKEAFAGNLHLYALDWDHGTRREIITVRGKSVVLSKDFSEGAWVTFENLNVAAGGIPDDHGRPHVRTQRGAVGDLPGRVRRAGWTNRGPARRRATGSGHTELKAMTYSPSTAKPTRLHYPTSLLTVEQGTRFQWAPSTTDPRALESADTKTRVAAALYDPNQIKLKLTFSAAYTGNLELYAVDWDSTARRETDYCQRPDGRPRQRIHGWCLDIGADQRQSRRIGDNHSHPRCGCQRRTVGHVLK